MREALCVYVGGACACCRVTVFVMVYSRPSAPILPKLPFRPHGHHFLHIARIRYFILICSSSSPTQLPGPLQAFQLSFLAIVYVRTICIRLLLCGTNSFLPMLTRCLFPAPVLLPCPSFPTKSTNDADLLLSAPWATCAWILYLSRGAKGNGTGSPCSSWHHTCHRH